MIRRCSCILLTKLRGQRPSGDTLTVAQAVYVYEGQSRSLEDLADTIEYMISAGSRYNNLEKALGVGAALVLGNEFAETL